MHASARRKQHTDHYQATLSNMFSSHLENVIRRLTGMQPSTSMSFSAPPKTIKFSGFKSKWIKPH
eukprot:3439021-Amphidinium_carterae.1